MNFTGYSNFPLELSYYLAFFIQICRSYGACLNNLIYFLLLTCRSYGACLNNLIYFLLLTCRSYGACLNNLIYFLLLTYRSYGVSENILLILFVLSYVIRDYNFFNFPHSLSSLPQNLSYFLSLPVHQSLH